MPKITKWGNFKFRVYTDSEIEKFGINPEDATICHIVNCSCLCSVEDIKRKRKELAKKVRK